MKSEVGPVLHACVLSEGVISAIRASNRSVRVEDGGAYLRVLAEGSCRVTRAAIEREVGHAFRLPGDLERIMSSFRGYFSVDDDEARWDEARRS